GAFRIKGGMSVTRNDPVWGDSFAGFVEGYFQPGIALSVNVQFGTVNNFRYWYADGLLILPTGIPISTGIALYGFGGGASMGVRQTFPASMKINTSEKVEFKSGYNGTLTGEAMSGVSFSGATYLPDTKMGLAIKAKVIFGTVGNPKPLNGEVGFGIGFTSNNGSVAYIRFEGKAYLTTDLGKGGPNAPASATCLIEYDFTNTSLKSLMEVYINFSVIKGRLAGNKAGYIDMYFSPQDWYIFVGHPDYEKRIGLKILGMFDIAAYMCMGKQIPDMPPPPAEVIKILGDSYKGGRDELQGDGGGFAFGASLQFSTGNIYLMQDIEQFPAVIYRDFR
ncbi:MAG: hypothetical protein K2Q22_13170, partial [Cytophagales bacterium]|nr:hypothetical protein [Cytophagales bacterium]